MWIQFISGQFGGLLALGNIKNIKLPRPGCVSAVPTVNINRVSWKGVTKEVSL